MNGPIILEFIDIDPAAIPLTGLHAFRRKTGKPIAQHVLWPGAEKIEILDVYTVDRDTVAAGNGGAVVLWPWAAQDGRVADHGNIDEWQISTRAVILRGGEA